MSMSTANSATLKIPFTVAAARLLGPPEARRILQSPPLATAKSHDTFVDLLDNKFNSNSSPPYNGYMGYTENRSPTFLTSGNPCLDFFFHVVPDTPPATVVSLLSSAWQHDPLTALKLVCNLRGVRGTGKSDREGFYAAALWLHDKHPKTLAQNVDNIAKFGYMKDLLFILQELIHGPRPDSEKIRRHDRVDPEKAAILRRKKRAEHALKAIERYANDPVYQFLHEKVAEFFAEQLSSDLENLRSGKLNNVGLAAKWCPTLYSSFDQRTLICESIARRIFPRESSPVYIDIQEEYYAYRIRDRLRKDVLAPLRKVLQLPECYLSAGQWGLLPYSRVPSVAMKNYKELFFKHDGERFKEFLGEVKNGKKKIAAGALLPHEIASKIYYDESDDEAAQVAELQWERMVQDLLDIGKLKNCIAVCDVSGSMTGTPMDVCVAMGLLLSELSEEPWKGRVITFSNKPQLHRIEGDTLRHKLRFVRRMDWQMNTDFQKVFDRLLEVAVEGKLEPDMMIKRVFVFSDMEFDQASQNHWETDYQAICRKFEEQGYGSCIPQIVFWNLRNSRSIPVKFDQKAVALVSGFSKNLVKLFLRGEEESFTPESIMEKAISGKEYDELAVVD